VVASSFHYSLRDLRDEVLKNLLTTNSESFRPQVNTRLRPAVAGLRRGRLMDTNVGTAERTTDLKLARLPSRSPLPFAALPSVSLLPAAPLTDDTDGRE
jgi:hypothetical protein